MNDFFEGREGEGSPSYDDEKEEGAMYHYHTGMKGRGAAIEWCSCGVVLIGWGWWC